MTYHRWIFSILLSLLLSTFAFADEVIHSCDRSLIIKDRPKRAVVHDINLAEMMFLLELQPFMVGYSGVTGSHKLSEDFTKQSKGIPQLAEKMITLEHLLAVNADFLFAGWNYGLKVAGTLTPLTLKEFGIDVYELTESCIHIMKKNPANFDDVYNDIINLGRIFHAQERALQHVNRFRQMINEVTVKTADIKQPTPVFLYDSGIDGPFTAGRYAIPDAMITAAGGKNIMNHMASSWAKSTWEAVVQGQPEVIIIVNYGETTWQQKKHFLKTHSALSSLPAIKNDRFIVLDYAEVTPGIRVFNATQHLAKGLHPSLLSPPDMTSDTRHGM